jgi:hypothetical protein
MGWKDCTATSDLLRQLRNLVAGEDVAGHASRVRCPRGVKCAGCSDTSSNIIDLCERNRLLARAWDSASAVLDVEDELERREMAEWGLAIRFDGRVCAGYSLTKTREAR